MSIPNEEARSVVAHEQRAGLAREGLPAAIAAANALLEQFAPAVTLTVTRDESDEPVRVELRREGKTKPLASIDYAGALAARNSVLQLTAAHLERQPYQEAKMVAAVAAVVQVGLAENFGVQPPAHGTSTGARGLARTVLAQIVPSLLAARRYEVTQGLKRARSASIRGRPAAARFLGEALKLAKRRKDDEAIRRTRQALESIPLAPLLFPPPMYGKVVRDLADGASIKKLLKQYGVSWSIRRLKAGLAGAVEGTDVELLGRLCEAAGSAGVIPPNTREQRYWLKVLKPLARRWATDATLQGGVVWLARAARDDLADSSVASALTSSVDPVVMADWLSADPAQMVESMRWGPRLTLEEGWLRAQRWDAERRDPSPVQTDKPVVAFGAPWLARGVVGDFEILPLEDSLALKDHGTEQRNCAGGYAGRVTAGNCYLYAVRRVGKRSSRAVATLELGCAVGVDGQPVPTVVQLLGPCNEPPKAAVAAAVEQWMSETARIAFNPHPAALEAASRFRALPLEDINDE